MLDSLFKDTVTVRRQVSRGVKGDIVFEEVLDDTGGPLPVKCRIERRRRRSTDNRGQEISLDATLLCRRTSKNFPEIGIEDVLVDGRTGEAWKIASRDEDNQMFGGQKYIRLGLVRTHLPVPEDKVNG